MKRNAMLALLMITALLACNQEDNDFDPGNAQDEITQGSWKISYYLDSGKDETSDFNPFTFFFLDTGVFEAKNANTTYKGTWGFVKDDGRDKLVIAISGPDPLDELDDDWVIIEVKNDSIKLEDDSSSPGDEEILHFRKN